MNPLIRYIASCRIKKAAGLPRNKQFIKIQQAKSIGLVFDATDKETFETVKKFIQQIKEYAKNVHAIGYVDEKITPNYSYVKTDIDIFNKKELNGFYKPRSPYIKTFMEDEKDILIDANIYTKLPLKYIAAASKAKCKIGIHSGDNELFLDMLLAISPGQGIEFFLQQSLKYLT